MAGRWVFGRLARGGGFGRLNEVAKRLDPAISGAKFVHLLAVSCPAKGSCVAVGDYEDTSDNLHALTETLANGTWTAATLPPGGLSPAVGTVLLLDAVSCPAVGSQPAGMRTPRTPGSA
jgi:hypothetical protein